jgi:hypothetical protein
VRRSPTVKSSFTIGGKRQTIAQWAREYSIDQEQLRKRIDARWHPLYFMKSNITAMVAITGLASEARARGLETYLTMIVEEDCGKDAV